ncbi:MAG: toprim domain-containing protein [bacterium]
MSSIDKLTEIFRKFPGVGPRQARRFVYHLLSRNDNTVEEIVENIKKLNNDVAQCKLCQRFFSVKQLDIPNVCQICVDGNREQNILMIVARDVDLDNMEKSRAFNGLYFVLGGNVPILEEKPSTFIRQEQLLERTKSLSSTSSGLKEVIIATSANPEGENTFYYVQGLLKKQLGDGVRVTTLGRGLSTGTELEYSDADTIKSAMMNRR